MSTSLVVLCAFGIGCVCGLRSMVAPAVVAWGAHWDWLRLQGWLSVFFANRITLIVFSVFALGELVADKLPFVPARTQIGSLVVRTVFGALSGAALCNAAATAPVLGAVLGAVGALAGSFAGYTYRRRLAAFVPDFVLALIEDVLAIGGGLLIVSRL